MKLPDSEMLGKIEREPRLLRLPLIRAAGQLSIGQDEAAWREMGNR
ncbi:MAG: ArsC/Spx/MgsR family protein [Bryobacteraceae bacterium]